MNIPRKNKIWICSASISLALFIVLLAVYRGNILSKIDASVNAFVPLIQSSGLTLAAKFVSFVFSFWPMFAATIAVTISLWIKKEQKKAYLFSATMIISELVITAIKAIVHRPRPINALVAAADYSFPSGHSAMAVVFLGMLYIMLIKKSNAKPDAKTSSTKSWTGFVLASAALAAALSRIYLNIHYLSDVLAAIFLGLFFVLLAAIINEKIAKEKKK